MENMWKFNLSDDSIPSPKELLKEQAELLPALTGDMVYASLKEETESGVIPIGLNSDDFVFSFSLRSKFLTNYRFRILTVGHSIPIYPVKLVLDEAIKSELKIHDSYYTEIKDEQQFKTMLKAILSSERIGSVISSIIKLSK